MHPRNQISLWLSVCCVVGLAASGCATTGEVKHGLGAGQWQVHLPTSTSPIDELAYGRGGGNDESLADLGDLDALLRPAPSAQPTTKPKPIRHVSALKRVAENPAPAPAAVPEPASPPPAAAVPVLLAENDAHDRYASREQQAQPQQQFRGGDAVIVISASALIIVLLVVLLILLLR
jgi:hypothetical protein